MEWSQAEMACTSYPLVLGHYSKVLKVLPIAGSVKTSPIRHEININLQTIQTYFSHADIK